MQHGRVVVTGASRICSHHTDPRLLPLENRVLLSATGLEPGLYYQGDTENLLFTGHCPCGCSGTPAMEVDLEALVEPVSSTVKHPLSALPLLSSNPGATAKLYLDFDGDIARRWGSYDVPATPAYDTDGDPTTFTDAELDNIQRIWARVAEKYSPFNVDVTTIDPGNLTRKVTLKVVIGGNGAWMGGTYGGVAYVGSFANSSPNIAYVFPKNLGNGNAKYVAEATAHEAGHAFGLQHQSTFNSSGVKVDEYNKGTSAKAPIMGNSYSATRGLWWLGPNPINATQNDLQILTNNTNGFGYRPDDHGNTISNATALNVEGSSVSGAGIIGNTNDLDYFSFVTGGGTVSFNIAVAQHGPMLRLRAEVLNMDGSVVHSANSSSLGEQFTTNLPPGEYRLVVASYGEYGDIGQYTISGTVPPYVPPQPAEVIATEFIYDQAPHVLRFRFNQDVSLGLLNGELVLENLTSGSSGSGGAVLHYDPSTNTVEYVIEGFVGGVLPDGRYRATLTGINGSTDVHSFEFFFLNGDANRDGKVDAADLEILALNWNGSGGWRAGDFNYDGVISFDDLSILARNWQVTLDVDDLLSSTSGISGASEPLVTTDRALSFIGRTRRPMPFASDRGLDIAREQANPSDRSILLQDADEDPISRLRPDTSRTMRLLLTRWRG